MVNEKLLKDLTEVLQARFEQGIDDMFWEEWDGIDDRIMRIIGDQGSSMAGEGS